ncbi:hypothetical protein [Micromonospora cremea]|uniref:Uncharacterized protein n=1 Tax=Micromonospora cremea TaxID=709881 RepID=A0A1N6AVK5_9ACTN|nr:hypothetical protein [Micromonospora cremea]SIN38076.1 hypothetical protein SAMN04489832_6237 [Micromonospora cremea]
MRVVRDSANVFVTYVDPPVTPVRLAELAAQLPPEAVCTEVVLDPDGILFATFEVPDAS